MKRFHHVLVLLTLISTSLLIQACETSASYLSIDYMEPGKILFPERIETLALINNTNEKDLSNKSENLKALRLSSSEIFEGFVGALAETEYYNRLVLADDKWITKDADFISKEQFKKMSESTEADAIVSVEALNIRDLNLTLLYPEPYTEYRLALYPILQIYNTKNNSITKVVDSDTISITDALFFTEQLSKNHKFSPEEYPYSGAYLIGQSMAKLLAPHWKTAERMIYTDTPTFKAANKLFDNNQLNEAIEEYKKIIDKKDKPVNRIKAAYNIAITYELMDELDEAYQWAKKSVELAQEHFNRTDTQLSYTLYEQNEIYFNSLYYTYLLGKRLEDKVVLDQQMKRFEAQK